MIGWLRDLFGIAPPPPDPQIGQRYVLRQPSPFPTETITCTVTGTLNGWVRYVLDDRFGVPSKNLIAQSDTRIKWFLEIWNLLP